MNGVFIAYLRLNPFIVTLASGAIFGGMTLVITKGYPIRPLRPGFTIFGQGQLLAVPLPVAIFLGAAAVLVWMLALTPFGRNIYAIGGNRDAAVLVGIPVARVEMFAYGLAGMFAALAGILYASRMDSGQPAVGEGWLMGAITAAILGGTSLKGGQGTNLRHGLRYAVDGGCIQRTFAAQCFGLLGTGCCGCNCSDRRSHRSIAKPGLSSERLPEMSQSGIRAYPEGTRLSARGPVRHSLRRFLSARPDRRPAATKPRKNPCRQARANRGGPR